MEELRRILAEGGSIYEELSFSLRHNIERTKASRASGMALVPAPMREESEESVQPLESAWANVETDVKSLVPAPMREDADESDQPLDSAGTYRMATMRVPAPRLELGTP